MNKDFKLDYQRENQKTFTVIFQSEKGKDFLEGKFGKGIYSVDVPKKNIDKVVNDLENNHLTWEFSLNGLVSK